MSKENIGIKDEKVRELFEAGAHLGFSRARRHPSVNQYIFGFKNRTAIVDLEKSLSSLEKAKELVKKIASEGKQILFVGSKNEAREAIRRAAESIDMPFVIGRWVGGTFSNANQIRSRINRMRDLIEKDKKGELSVYKKKERGMIAIELEKLQKNFANIDNMEKLPAVVFVVDPKEEKIAVDEANQVNIPVIALSGTDCDVRGIKYPVIANDASKATIDFFAKSLALAYAEGKALVKATPAKAE